MDPAGTKWIKLGAAGAGLALVVGVLVWLLTSPPVAEEPVGLPPPYDEQIELLKSPESTEALKLMVVDQMGADRGNHATTLLIEASGDDSAQVAVQAIKLLSYRVDDRVAAHLVSLLGDDEFRVRAWAARALGAAGRSETLTPLEIAYARETHPAAQRQMAKAIDLLSIAPPPTGGEAGE